MMYLRGAGFGWFFSLWPIWAVVNGLLLLIYFFTDMYYYKKESETAVKWDKAKIQPIKVKGLVNFIWLGGVVLAVAFINPNTLSFVSSNHPSSYLREIAILVMALLSLVLTKQYIRKANLFSWDPILEVTYLFLGIFITMVPCLLYLQHNAALLNVQVPHKFYYATGALSSFLDNTPTAVTFYYLAMGLVQGNPALLQNTTVIAGLPEAFLAGISVGAVLFGSMTYIGNGPNFMVKAIAESQGVKMPDFFSYMYKFSLIVLLPIFILIQLLFF
jgi:Na+/H+ antiporter NhaD/arsenite permease-like protein